MTAIMWFRRDLRVADNSALRAAAARGPVLALFVVDPRLIASSGAPRLTFLRRSLDALTEATDGHLVIRVGGVRCVVSVRPTPSNRVG